MGTTAAPNFVISIIDLSTGGLDTGETVEILLDGDTYPGDAVALSEIGVTGRYKKEAGVGVAAVLQGIYHVYVGGTFNGIYTHGYTGLQDHLDSSADPHSVIGDQVAITDSGAYYTGSDVETILQEVGASLTSLPGALLTDSSSQSVDVAKAKITNLDADKVDGAHVGTGEGDLVALNSSSDIPLANIPDTLTGKDADSVDGHDVGTVAGNIPEIGSGAGKLGISMLAKVVGTGDDNIPQISTDNPPDAGKVHSTILGVPNTAMVRYKKYDSVISEISKPSIQTGFVQFDGDDTGDDQNITLTFPSSFDTVPIVLVSPAGYGVSPVTPDDFDLTESDIIVASVWSPSATAVLVRIQRASGNWNSARSYGFNWIAIGTDTPL